MSSAIEYLRELNKAAEVEIETSKPLKWYLRSTELVFKQACVYYSESDLEKAYVLFMKYSNLIMTQLPRHPEYNKTEHAEAKLKLKKNCFRAVDILERLRPVLESNFTAALEERKRAQAAAEEAEMLRQRQEIQLAKLKEIQLEQQREREREAAKQAESQAALPAVSYALPVEITPNAVPVETPPLAVASSATAVFAPVVSQFVPSSEPVCQSASVSTIAATAPIVQNAPIVNAPPPVVEPLSIAKKQPRFFSESGRPLRPVHVPASIIDKFLSIAAENTRRNVETCGVIAGKLHQDEFTITCLIIPKQTGTSDTCSMTNEEEIVDAQDQMDVMSLGWIHTHPTQTCFLSSVDLHTHMPFQMLMEEAIAIVCAPSKTPNFGIFRLTDPPGLDLINKCPRPGGSFHAHPEGVQIYRELKGPEAHAQIQHGLPLDVVDLRFK